MTFAMVRRGCGPNGARGVEGGGIGVDYERMNERFGDEKYLSVRLIISSSLLWSWSLLFFSNLFNLGFPVFDARLFVPIRLAHLIAGAVVALLVFLARANVDPLAAGLAASVGVALLYAAELASLPALACVGAALSGGALVSLMVFHESLRTSTHFGSEVYLLACSLFASVGLTLLVAAMPRVVGIAYMALALPLIRFAHPTRTHRLVHRFTAESTTHASRSSMVVEVLVFVASMAVGTLLAGDVFDYGRPFSHPAAFDFAAVVCAAVALASLRLMKRALERFSTSNAVFALVISVSGFLLLLIPILVLRDVATYVAVTEGYTLFVFGSIFLKEIRLDTATDRAPGPTSRLATPVYFMSCISYPVGLLAGFCLGRLAMAPLIEGATVYDLAVVASIAFLLALCLMLFEVLLVPVKPPDDPQELIDRNRDEACRLIAEEYGLTPRETEVLRILADGFSLPYVQEKLYISRGTATVHCSNIYRKVGVHKRDELLSLLAARELELRRKK